MNYIDIEEVKIESDDNDKKNASSSIKKKIRKVVEEMIIENNVEFAEKFSEEEMVCALKHKSQIAKLAVEDDLLENIIKDEVEDCIGAFLLKRYFKKK